LGRVRFHDGPLLVFQRRGTQGVNNAFSNLPCGRWLTDDELRQAGVFFEDRRFGEQIYL